MSDFAGLPSDAFEFYRDLEADNTREWWAANKDRYARVVRTPMEALLAELASEFGEGTLYRPYRDVRFSQDKSPLKGTQGALVAASPGMGFYLQVGPDGVMTGGGFHPQGSDQTDRMRAAIDAPASGTELVANIDALRSDGFVLAGDKLKTKPRGVSADHPRLDLLRYKHIVVTREYGEPSWVGTADVVEHVRSDWELMRPLLGWLEAHVGASTKPMGRAGGR
jgi:uncharacterized protein (TIGR02453 family)